MGKEACAMCQRAGTGKTKGRQRKRGLVAVAGGEGEGEGECEGELARRTQTPRLARKSY